MLRFCLCVMSNGFLVMVFIIKSMYRYVLEMQEDYLLNFVILMY